MKAQKPVHWSQLECSDDRIDQLIVNLLKGSSQVEPKELLRRVKAAAALRSKARKQRKRGGRPPIRDKGDDIYVWAEMEIELRLALEKDPRAKLAPVIKEVFRRLGNGKKRLSSGGIGRSKPVEIWGHRYRPKSLPGDKTIFIVRNWKTARRLHSGVKKWFRTDEFGPLAATRWERIVSRAVEYERHLRENQSKN